MPYVKDNEGNEIMLKTMSPPDKEIELFILKTKEDGCQVEKIMYPVDLKYVCHNLHNVES